jgi:phosphohistidine phosphatase
VIWLLRHGDAEEGDGDDAARRLTGEGERQADDAGRALLALGIPVSACLSSPKVRAMDTARLACRHLDVEPEEVDELAGGDFDPYGLVAARGLAEDADVVLVGHEPDMSNAIRSRTGGTVKLKKGGLAALAGEELHALLRPAELSAIAKSA